MLQIILILLAIGLAFQLIQWLWILIKKIFPYVLGLGLIVLGLMFYQVTIPLLIVYGIYRMIRRFKESRQISKWLWKKPRVYKDEVVDEMMLTASEGLKGYDHNDEAYIFDSMHIPYGRVNAFLNYHQSSIQEEEIYYYSAIKSELDNEIREYGMAVTNTGLFFSTQYSSGDSENPYGTKDQVIPYKSLYKVTKTGDKLTFYHIDHKKKKWLKSDLYASQSPVSLEGLKAFSESLIGLELGHAILRASLVTQKDIKRGIDRADKEFKTYQRVKGQAKVIETAGIMGAQEGIHGAYKEVNYHMNGQRGAGYAAEYGNNVVDRLKMNDVINEAQNLDANGRQVKGGADRIVNGVEIQTKYYKTANESIGAAFRKGEAVYINSDGNMMQIEVPRDQYFDALDQMQKRIDKGQVPGAQPGDPASDYVKKGFFTYEQSYNIASAGSLESLAVDVAEGVVVCSYAGGISGAIAFAMAIWSGKSVEEAAKIGLRTGIQVLGKGAIIYTVSMQLSRDKIINPFVAKQMTKDGVSQGFSTVSNPVFAVSEKLANNISNSGLANSGLGQSMGLNQLNGRLLISSGVTAAVVFGPDVCRALSGRISSKQLFKNSAVSASGIGGGMIGQVLIPIPVVGAMVGGMVAGFVAKAALDSFIEDDAKLMFQILKEEFLDVVTIANLDQAEFELVVTLTISHKKLPVLLRDMYASKEYRSFARQAIVTAAVRKVLSNRNTIYTDQINQGYQALLTA